jgi:hypothetical protein
VLYSAERFHDSAHITNSAPQMTAKSHIFDENVIKNARAALMQPSQIV